ncbi:hypothetical protein ACODT5_34955 [Streptomyces sp. 5.8]|uniref:hypothetical protein n=1 Tax=Streptomyces sp. 5.8 TaxID=3406571 RepID=UPI003BB8006E
MTTPSSSAAENRYARYRAFLDTGTGASQTLTQWLPLATLWATGDAVPGSTTRRPQRRRTREAQEA